MKTVQLSLEATQDIFGDWLLQKAKEHGLDGLDADLVSRWLADEISNNSDIYRDAEGVFQPHPDFAESIVHQTKTDFADRINQTLAVMNSVLAHTFEGQGSDQAAFAAFLKSKFKDPNLICDTSDPKKLEAFADALCERFWEEFDIDDREAFTDGLNMAFGDWYRAQPWEHMSFHGHDEDELVELNLNVQRFEDLGPELFYKMTLGYHVVDGQHTTEMKMGQFFILPKEERQISDGQHTTVKIPLGELRDGLSDETIHRLHEEVCELFMGKSWRVRRHDSDQYVFTEEYYLQDLGRFTPAEQARIDELVEYIYSVDQSPKPQP